MLCARCYELNDMRCEADFLISGTSLCAGCLDEYNGKVKTSKARQLFTKLKEMAGK